MERGSFGGYQPWATHNQDDLSIAELVRNGTVSAEIAGVLWAAAEAELSFLTVAVPRSAGKSTTSQAVLALRRPEVPIHHVYGDREELEALKQARLGGYIVVGEISQAPIPGYIWGQPVRWVFDTLSAGYSLQTCLHAPGVGPAIQVVTLHNGISDEQASVFKLVLYIEMYRTRDGSVVRRLVDVYEVDKVENGAPVGRSLFQWRMENDSFEKLADPVQFGTDTADVQRRSEVIAELAANGTTSANDVATAVALFRDGR